MTDELPDDGLLNGILLTVGAVVTVGAMIFGCKALLESLSGKEERIER
jgi:hypothetical protein